MNENNEQGKPAPELVQTSNVIELATGKPLLPNKIRASLMGQYVESKESNHSAEQFVMFFEKRLLSDMAYEGAKAIKKFFSEIGEK